LYAAVGALFFFLALNFVQVQKYSATAAGGALLPFIVIMFVLSRWSGGLVDRFGARLPLVIGPFVAAAGFALFAIPGVGAGYLFGFLPAILVLGLGMTATVAPLTTTVMNSVPQEQAGVASGINNAVSRTAGLLAIAVFGVVMLVSFSGTLERRLNQLSIDEGPKQNLVDQRVKLAGIEIPANLNAGDKESVQIAIDESFIAGFRTLMLISAALAAASGLISWILIRSNSRATSQH